MLEFTNPATYTVPENASLVASVFRFAKEQPGHVPFQRRKGDTYYDVTSKQFADEVTTTAKGLVASGIEAGDRVAIMSGTRYEWIVLNYAIWATGATTVAIYETSSAEQAKWILEDSGTKLLVVGSATELDTVADVAAAAPDLVETLVFDNGALAEIDGRGSEIGDEVIAERTAGITAKTGAVLIYTSGTTGRPKGVQLTHGNYYAEVAAVRTSLAFLFRPGSTTLLFLPLAHCFAQAIAFGAFETGVTVAHHSDTTTLVEQFAIFKPTFILSVPRVFEKVYNGAKQKAYDGGKGSIFEKAEATAIEWSKAQDTGGPGLGLKLKHAVFDKLVYSKLKTALGGNCVAAVSGGAALGARLGHFFRGIGVPVYEGYGLTETSAAITVNSPEFQRVGSVGRPIPGMSAKIAEDGELLLKGPVVFEGYWKNPEATAEAIRDGWFHSGDIATIDENGFVSITGRKKEIIVTAGGKNVAPAILEDAIRAHPLVSQCLVVGDAKPFIGALITLDPEALPGWKQRHNLPESTTVAELSTNPDMIAELDELIATANKHVSKAEAVKKYKVLDADFTIESGEMTPTMKLKRNIIQKERAAAIDSIYS
ncbi:AMP-dependent synthetase/ligase [Millisia brevis]|uniref:AMP-dependent synthetase/ligase n=1 Tax=Millisia brevis TaxID=264148 RepID=UPI0008354534|nr:AMP-dependent synthetase/ligase [Millisia brevis]